MTSLSSSAGVLADTYGYDSFGALTVSTGPLANPFQYTGRDYDPETGLQYYRARYYDPSLGHFISEDPVRFAAGSDFYIYAQNQPTNMFDPTGLKSTKCCPSKEERDIRKEAETARRFIEQLDKFGYIPATMGSVGATTLCIGLTVRGTNIELPPEYFINIVRVDPKKQPCVYQCYYVHEMVHARMCKRLGARRFSALTESQLERPAYMTELGCYIKLLQDSGLEPDKQK